MLVVEPLQKLPGGAEQRLVGLRLLGEKVGETVKIVTVGVRVVGAWLVKRVGAVLGLLVGTEVVGMLVGETVLGTDVGWYVGYGVGSKLGYGVG